MRFPCFILGLLLTASVGAQSAAFVPSNPPEMKPLTNHASPAYKTAAHFLRGANLGNYLEIPAGENWGINITTNDLDRIKSEGFDHIRVPVGWHYYAGQAPDYKLTNAIFKRVDFIVTNALSRGLGVMINLHHFDEITTNPAGATAEFITLWQQVAQHYASQPDGLVFELLNEPREEATTAVLNPIYARVITEIRKTNPQRTLVVGPSDWNKVEEFKNFVLPADDDNLMVTFHCYDPFYFTHQGAPWAGEDVKVKGIQFPGPPEAPLVPDTNLVLKKYVLDWVRQYNKQPAEKNPSGPVAFADRLKFAQQWSDYYGRPVYIGEFGAYVTADPVSRANYYGAFRRAAEEHKMGWAIWDWNAGFRYWNSQKKQPEPGMREALFGRK